VPDLDHKSELIDLLPNAHEKVKIDDQRRP